MTFTALAKINTKEAGFSEKFLSVKIFDMCVCVHLVYVCKIIACDVHAMNIIIVVCTSIL